MKVPRYLKVAHDMLLEAQSMQDYLDILAILNTGAALKQELVESDKIKARIQYVIDEMKGIEQLVVYCTLCKKQIMNDTGGIHMECGGPTEQVWPAEPRDFY